jgi:phospholipase D1/2
MSSVRVLQGLVVLAVVVAVVLAFTCTPIGSISSLDDVQRVMAPVLDHPLLPLFVLAAFLVTSLFMLSVWLMILQTCLLFPPLTAIPLALGGALLSAVCFYGLGKLLGRDVVTRHAPRRAQQLLARVSLPAMITVRILPVLPFTVVNVCCGAFNVRFRTYVAGSALGMAPGIIALSLLGMKLVDAVRHPTPTAIAGLATAIVVVVVAAVMVRRRLQRTPAP